MSNEQSIRDEIAKVAYRAWREAQRGAPIPEIELEALGSRLEERWMQEVANSILASPVIRRIQAEALAQAAEVLDEPYRLWSGDYRAPGGRWERGPNVRLVDDPEESPRAESLGVADWLRTRADRIERGETAWLTRN